MAKKKKLLSKLEAILSESGPVKEGDSGAVTKSAKPSAPSDPFSMDSPPIEETCQLIEDDLFRDLEKKLEEEALGEKVLDTKTGSPQKTLGDDFGMAELFSASLSTQEISPDEIDNIRNLTREDLMEALSEESPKVERRDFSKNQKGASSQLPAPTTQKGNSAPANSDGFTFSGPQPVSPPSSRKKTKRDRKKIREAILAQLREDEDQDLSQDLSQDQQEKQQDQESFLALMEEDAEKQEMEQKKQPSSALPVEVSSGTITAHREEGVPNLSAEQVAWQREKEELLEKNQRLQQEMEEWRRQTQKLAINQKSGGDIEGELQKMVQTMAQQKVSLRETQINYERIQLEKRLVEEEREHLKNQLMHLTEVAGDLKEIPSMEQLLEFIDATRRQLKKDTSLFYEKIQDKLKRIQDKFFHLEKVITYVRELKDLLKDDIGEVQRNLQSEKDKRDDFEKKLADFEERVHIAQNHSLFFKEKCREMERQIGMIQVQKKEIQERAEGETGKIAGDLVKIEENTRLLNGLLKKILER